MPTPTPTTIRKRNGKIVSFDTTKITFAIERAFFSVTNNPHREESQRITERVLQELQKRSAELGDEYVPSVEDVQDLVEVAVMEHGFYTVARAYIVYRFEHQRIRESAQEDVQEKIQKSELLVTKRDGRKELFSLAKLRKVIERVGRDTLENVNVEAILEQCAAEVYDGIHTRDVAHTLVLAARSFIEHDPAYSTLASRLLLETVVYKDAIGRKPYPEDDFERAYQDAFLANLEREVDLGLVDSRLLEFNLRSVADALKPERDGLLRYLGTQTLCDRYFIRDKSGTEYHQYLETPQMLWMRVAMGLAINEDHREARAKEFYDVLSTLRFVSSTPTLFHSGTPHPQLSSCYLSVVDDSLESIYKRYADNAQLSKWAGGIGDSWTKVRATGARVKSSGIESNGVIAFLNIQDASTVAINRSGRRRGATCVYLETWHYDIEDFLELRKNTGDERRRTHDLNTANWIPDLFMQRVREDGSWTLFSPDEVSDLHEIYGSRFKKRYEEYERMAQQGEIKLFKTIRARDLWKKMLTQLFETGHPWITFKDPCNVRSPQDHVGVVHSSNLCTEITLNTIPDEETAVCNLGSVNLAQHMKDGKLDETRIRDTVRLAMRMLDNVIDLNFYPTEDARRSNMRHRPVGLGVMGLQDALFMASVSFASEEAVRFSDRMMEVVSYYAIWSSSELARERGTYQSYAGSKWERGIFPIDTLRLLAEERGEPVRVDLGVSLDWRPVRESVARYGMRNSNCMAIAPTATISNIAGCFPTIEPIYKNIYVKANISGNFIVMNNYLVNDLRAEGLWNTEMLEIIKGQEGNIQTISSIPDWIKEKHREVFDIAPEWLIRAAAHRGKWIDQSQSVNIFYNGLSGNELSEAYLYAWQSGLKTTYYLRTLGASAVEQSTVSLEKQRRLDTKRAQARDMVQEIKQEVLVVAPKKDTQKESVVSTTTTDQSKKLCMIDDSDCESCQ